MDLDKYSTKESLQELVKNKDEFFDVVVDSNGFILEMLKTEGVKPDLDMLLDNISLHTFQYIKDNFQLNAKQLEKITEFIKDDRPDVKKLSQEEIGTYLKEKKPLPPGTILSLEQMNNLYKEIEQQFNVDYSDIEEILEKSFGKLSLEETFNVNKILLKKNTYIMNARPAFFNDEKYRELYKEIVLAAYNKPDMKLFRNYVFTEKDKDFLHELLKNDDTRGYWASNYSDYSNIKGFTNLVDKYEFFAKYNNENINHFSDGEVENNVEIFKKSFLENSDKRHYEIFSGFFRRKMTIHQFKTIFDADFVSRYIEDLSNSDRKISRFFGNEDAEHDKTIIDKKAHLARVISDLFAEDVVLGNGKKFTEISDFHYIFSLREDLERQRNDPLDPVATEADTKKLEENYHSIFNNIIPKFLNNENFEKLAHHADDMIYPLTINLAEEYFKNNVNVNNFYLLSLVYEEYRDKHMHNYNKVEFIDTLKKYFSTMHAELVKRNNHDELAAVNIILADVKKYKENKYKQKTDKTEDDYIKSLIKATPNRKGFINSDENNFLAFETNGVNESTMWRHVYILRPDLVDYVLEKNITPPRDFIHYCLNTIGNPKTLKFVKEFAKRNRSDIEKDEELLANFLANPKQEEIFPLDSKDSLELSFKEVMDLLRRTDLIDTKKEEIKKLYPRMDMPYSFGKNYPEIDIEKFDENIEIAKDISEKEAKTLYLYLYKKSELLGNKIRTKEKLISYGFMFEKLEEFISKKDFKSVDALRDNRTKYSDEPFIKYVSTISFEELKKDLESDSFFNILKNQIDYDNKTKVKFPKFTYEQNMELAVKLLDRYKEKTESEGIRYTYKFLYLYADENRDFVKEFVLEHFPVSVFYGYDFRPEGNTNIRDDKFIKGTYSNEEIYKAFMKMEENGGFLSYRDVNADFKGFFSDVFFPDKRNNKEKVTDERFKEFLSFIKDKSPMLYSFMANEYIFNSVLDTGSPYNGRTPKYRTRDEGAHHYVLENFDLDTILKGLQEVVDKMKAQNLDENGQDVINKKLASYAISNMVRHTLYELFDNTYSGNYQYESCMSHEDTIKVMKFLFEQAPQHFLERRRVGQALDMVSFFKNNIDEFYSFNNIKNFILPNSDIYCEYLQLQDSSSGESPSKQRLLEYTRIIIETALEKKDKQVLNFMTHSIAQHKYIEKQNNTNYRYGFYKGIESQVIDIIASDKIVEGLLTNAKLKIDLDETLIVNEPVKKKSNKL